MGAKVSSTYTRGPPDRLPNNGISPIHFPNHVTTSTQQQLLIALEHRYYHRYLDTEDILLNLLHTLEDERDVIQTLIHYGMLRVHMGINAPHEVIYNLAVRINTKKSQPYPVDPAIRQGAIMNADPVEKGLRKRMRVKVEKMDLDQLTASEILIVQLLGLQMTDTGNYREKEQYVTDLYRKWEATSSSGILYEHEIWIHFLYHRQIRSFSLHMIRYVKVVGLIERLIPEGRLDAIIDFNEFLDPHGEYRVQIQALFQIIMQNPNITKRQHTRIRMIFVDNASNVKEKLIQGDEIQQLMTECNDHLYSKVQTIGQYSHRYSGNLDEAQTLAAITEMKDDTTALEKLKCFKEALAHSKIYTVRSLQFPVWEGPFDLSLERTLQIQLHRCRDPPEEFASYYKYCLDVAMEDQDILKMEKILEIIRRLRKRYPLWTLTDGTNHLVPYTKYAYEKVCKHGLGMPVAMLAAHEYLASMSISDPGGTEESKAAYQCLLQNMKSIDYIEQKKSNLPAVVTRCQQVEFMAMRWIQVDRSKKRFELAFMKAHLISGLVFLDPLRCPNNQNGMPNVAPELMRELMNLSPKRARAEQSNKVLTYLEEYNNTFPFQTLVNKFMYD